MTISGGGGFSLTGLEKYYLQEIYLQEINTCDPQKKTDAKITQLLSKGITERIRGLHDFHRVLKAGSEACLKLPHNFQLDIQQAYQVTKEELSPLRVLQANDPESYHDLKIIELLDEGILTKVDKLSKLIEASEANKKLTEEACPVRVLGAVEKSPEVYSGEESVNESYLDDVSYESEEYYDIPENLASFCVTKDLLAPYNLLGLEVYYLRQVQLKDPSFTTEKIIELLQKGTFKKTGAIYDLYQQVYGLDPKLGHTMKEDIIKLYNLKDRDVELLIELQGLDPVKYNERKLIELLDQEVHEGPGGLETYLKFAKEMDELKEVFEEQEVDFLFIIADYYHLTAIEIHYVKEIHRMYPTEYTEEKIRKLLEDGIQKHGDLMHLYNSLKMQYEEQQMRDHPYPIDSVESSDAMDSRDGAEVQDFSSRSSTPDSEFEQKGDVVHSGDLIRNRSYFTIKIEELDGEMPTNGVLANVKQLETTPFHILSTRDVIHYLKVFGDSRAASLLSKLEIDASHLPEGQLLAENDPDLKVDPKALEKARIYLGKLLENNPDFIRRDAGVPIHKKWNAYLLPSQIIQIKTLQSVHPFQFSDEVIRSALANGDHLNGQLEQVFQAVMKATVSR